MITKLEEALKALKDHEETGNYTALYAGLKLIIQANKSEANEIDPLMRSVTFTVLEPLFLQVEKHLQDAVPEEPEIEKEELGKVIFVDFAKRKRLAA